MVAKKSTARASHRAHIFYTGRVQGVGFRFTAERIALEIGLLGWVKNLPDNRVEIVCEGSEIQIQKLLEGVNASFLGPHIKKVTCDWEKPTGQFKDFSIEFCC
jgi:acylphosphatase